MKFIDPATGADVAEGQFDTHQFRFLAAEEGDRFDFFRTIQPSAGWGVINGVEVIEYPSALQWSLHVGQVGPDALELRVQKRGLLTTAAIGSCLKVVVAAIIDKDASLSLREHTKGVFLERSKRAVGKMPAANRRDCIFGAVAWITLPDPTTALQAQYVWVGLVSLGTLAEQGTHNAAAVGWTMYAAAGHGPADKNGQDGPLQKILKRVRNMIPADQRGDDNEDVAVTVAESVKGHAAPVKLAVYRPPGPLRVHAAAAEVDRSQPREATQDLLFRSRAHEVIGGWEVLDLATKGAEASGAIATHVEAIMRASGLRAILAGDDHRRPPHTMPEGTMPKRRLAMWHTAHAAHCPRGMDT